MNNKYVLFVLTNPLLNKFIVVEKVKPVEQKGKLNFPGGKVEPGEKYLDAVRRECLEETGIDVDNFKLQGYVKGGEFSSLGADKTFTMAVYNGYTHKNEIKPQENEVEIPFWISEEEFHRHPNKMSNLNKLRTEIYKRDCAYVEIGDSRFTHINYLPFLLLESEEVL